MNPWPFVIAAYAVVLLAVSGLAFVSFLAMWDAEK